MDLQELVNIWKNTDQELENKIKINKNLFKEVTVNKIRVMLGEFKWTNIVEICFNFVFLIYLIGFFIDHFSVLRYAIPSGILMLIMFYSLSFNIHMLKLFFRIDVKSSIVQNQKIVERLRYYNVLDTRMLYVIIPLFSTPFLIVMAKAFFDFNLYRLGQWLVMFSAGSFVVALIVVYLLRRFPDKKMQKAITFLSEISDFKGN